jgi:hypothetical protein
MAVTTKKDLEAVRELRRLLTFERASFDNVGPPPVGAAALPASEKQVNAFIGERTRLWRESWVFPLLDQLEGRKST